MLWDGFGVEHKLLPEAGGRGVGVCEWSYRRRKKESRERCGERVEGDEGGEIAGEDG